MIANMKLLLPPLLAALTAPQAQAVGQLFSFEVDQQYTATMTFGSSLHASVTALLNIDWTLVTSVTCSNCGTRVYNASGRVLDQETLTLQYPMATSLSFATSRVQDTVCLVNPDDAQICTPAEFLAIESQGASIP